MHRLRKGKSEVYEKQPERNNDCSGAVASLRFAQRSGGSCSRRPVGGALDPNETAFAQNAESIADREVQRRQSAIPAGEAALARGKSALRSRNYTVAFQESRRP